MKGLSDIEVDEKIKEVMGLFLMSYSRDAFLMHY